ncbi:MAG TPA: CRISPR-associated protein Cas4 [Candidatus Dormibacteraeota bacterium]|nr:CRISPR-associated protein Cas4 [Candidatus Dormibacteraeota bacterium]
MRDPIPISALQHYSYCPRQCALIHVEQTFEDNVFTQRGQLAHARADRPGETDRRIRFALPLWSDRLGLVGKADAVELRPEGPYPVEYKVGRHRGWQHDAVQLCAQALCLEEMLACTVPEGALFYRASQERVRVRFSPQLRAETERVVEEVHRLVEERRMPPPVADRRCRHCSLIMVCLPWAVNRRRTGQLLSSLYRP